MTPFEPLHYIGASHFEAGECKALRVLLESAPKVGNALRRRPHRKHILIGLFSIGGGRLQLRLGDFSHIFADSFGSVVES